MQFTPHIILLHPFHIVFVLALHWVVGDGGDGKDGGGGGGGGGRDGGDIGSQGEVSQ